MESFLSASPSIFDRDEDRNAHNITDLLDDVPCCRRRLTRRRSLSEKEHIQLNCASICKTELDHLLS